MKHCDQGIRDAFPGAYRAREDAAARQSLARKQAPRALAQLATNACMLPSEEQIKTQLDALSVLFDALGVPRL